MDVNLSTMTDPDTPELAPPDTMALAGLTRRATVSAAVAVTADISSSPLLLLLSSSQYSTHHHLSSRPSRTQGTTVATLNLPWTETTEDTRQTRMDSRPATPTLVHTSLVGACHPEDMTTILRPTPTCQHRLPRPPSPSTLRLLRLSHPIPLPPHPLTTIQLRAPPQAQPFRRCMAPTAASVVAAPPTAALVVVSSGFFRPLHSFIHSFIHSFLLFCPNPPAAALVPRLPTAHSPLSSRAPSNQLVSPTAQSSAPPPATGFSGPGQQFAEAPNPRSSVPPPAISTANTATKRRSDRDDDRLTPSDRHSRQPRR
jgi:hypothetical protein